MYCGPESSRYKDCSNLINLVSGDEFSPHVSSSFQPDVGTGTFGVSGSKSTSNDGSSKEKNFEKPSNKTEESGHMIVKEGSEVIREVKDGMVIERNHKWEERSVPCSSGDAGSGKGKPFLYEETSEKTPGCSTTGFFVRTKPGFEKHAHSGGFYDSQSSLNGWNNSSPASSGKRSFSRWSDPVNATFNGPWEKSYSAQSEKDMYSSGYQGHTCHGNYCGSSMTQPSSQMTAKNPAEKPKPAKPRATVLTQKRKLLVQEFRETDSDRLWGEKWQRALWKFMVERDATVKLSDIERWVKTYKPNYNSPHSLFHPGKKVTIVDVKERKHTEGKKEEKASKTPRTDEIVCKTRSVFVWFDDRNPVLPNDVATWERAVVKRLTAFNKGQVEKRQFLPETQRFYITFGKRGSATQVVRSRDRPGRVNDRHIKIQYAPPPSLLYTFQEKYFDKYSGISKFPKNELRVRMEQLMRECDVEK